MEKMAISKFKTQCNVVIERVRRTKTPVLITRFGKPVAGVLPPPPVPKSKDCLGSLAGTGRIVGDIISPTSDETDWEALR